MTEEEALSFIRTYGIVLASARGPVPNLAEAIAGEPVRGSWWSHPRGKEIFRIFGAIEDHPDVLVCRLVKGKVTYVDQRRWPALLRSADRLPIDRIARVKQEHTAAGHHVNRTVPFPDWVPAEVVEQAKALDAEEAWAILALPTNALR